MYQDTTLSSLCIQHPSLQSTIIKKIILHHLRVQINYTSKIRHLSWDYNLLHILINIEQAQTFHTSTESIKEYVDIVRFLIKARREANSKVTHLHTMGVQSFRTINLEQLRIHLSNLLIKLKDKKRRSKLNTICKLSNITGKW